jgi:hypothetical protein
MIVCPIKSVVHCAVIKVENQLGKFNSYVQPEELFAAGGWRRRATNAFSNYMSVKL